MNELKPCPFCGGEAEIIGGPEDWHPTYDDPDSGGHPYAVVCECGCGMYAAYYDAQQAIDAWNRRKSSPIVPIIGDGREDAHDGQPAEST